MDLQTAIDRLQAVPLESFAAERTRLARELRKGGDRAAAAEVAKSPKPSAPAWALNHIAREDPEVLEEWLNAAEALREASSGAGQDHGSGLRDAMGEHRAATSLLMTAVRDRAHPSGRPLSEAMLDRVRRLLHAATLDDALADDLRAGTITEEPAATPDSEPAPGPEPLEPKSRPRASKSSHTPSPPKAPKRDREAEARAERRAALESRLQAACDELDSGRSEAERCATAAQSADERLDEARSELHHLESAAAAARSTAAAAGESVAAAEQKVQELRALL